MERLDLFDEEDGDTVFRDVIFLALAGFMAIVLLLLPHLNPPAKQNEEVASPGNVIVETYWPKEANADVDLWVKAPGDVAVGYSNKSSKIFDLLRDDLGDPLDITEMNYEVSYSRGAPDGEYTVNTHLYRSYKSDLPLPVTVVITVKSSPQSPPKKILSKKIMLSRVGQELTVFRFSLDKEGRLISGSVHDLPKPLRAKTS